MVEHPKSKSTQPKYPRRWRTLYMLFERCHTKKGRISLKHHIKYFNFRSKIKLDHPVVRASAISNSSVIFRDIYLLFVKWSEIFVVLLLNPQITSHVRHFSKERCQAIVTPRDTACSRVNPQECEVFRQAFRCPLHARNDSSLDQVIEY